MATTTFHEHNGNGSQKDFTYTFPTYKESEVKVEVNHVAVDNWTVVSYANSGTMTVRFDNTTGTLNTDVCESDGSPKSGTKNVLIYRETDVDSQKSTFQAGAAVKAGDLNTLYTHSLRTLQDNTDQKITTAKLRDGSVTSDKIRNDSIVNADINSAAEIAVTKLGQSTTDKQVIQTNGSNVEWTSSIDLPGTLGVDGVTTLKNEVNVQTGNKVQFKNASGTVKTDINCDTGVIRVGTGLSEQSGDAAIFNGKVIVFGDDLECGGGNLIVASDNKEFAVQNASGADKFTVDTDNGNTVIEGTLNGKGAVDFDSTLNVDGNATFKGDVTLDDTKKATFGNSADLEIYHDGSNSYIKDTGTGSLRLQADGFSISDGGSNTFIGGTGAATQLWSGSGIKLATSSTGVTVTGETKTTTLEIGGTDVTASATELNILDGKTFKTSSGTLDSTSDTEIPSSKVINTRIVAVADQIGGFVPVADKDNFPTSNPDPSGGAGTVVSISDATGISVNSSGVGSLATRAGGSDAVIINGFPSAMRGGATHGPTDRQVTNANPYIIPSGVGLLVQTTSTPHTYDYHKVQPTESDIVTLNDTVEDFQARYRLGSSNPGSANNEGDLFFNTTTNKMLVYNGSAWADISATGNYFSTTTAVAGAEGDTIPGGQAAFDGTAKKFKLSLTGDQIPSNAFQITVSLNGVIQKPNSGTTVPSEGFAWDDTNDWIIFADAIPLGTPYFIVVSGSQVNVTTVQDDEIDLAQLKHQTAGQILYYGASGVPALLTKDVGKFLKSGTNGPTWDTVTTTTNLSNTANGTSLTVESSTGTNTALPAATTSAWGVMTDEDKTKLDGIEASATADQTGAEIKSAYEGESDTNAFTDADHTKLDGIATEATKSPTTNRGDIIYRGASADQRLAKGSAGQVLKMGADDPEWGAASVGTITALNNQTADRLTTIGATTTELDGEASLTFNDAATTGLISARQATARGFECPAEVSDDWTIAAGNNAMFPGPMTVAAGKTITVPATRTLHIL